MAKALMAFSGNAVGKKKNAPKRLSKLGEWMRANPNGIGLIVHDMKALMR